MAKEKQQTIEWPTKLRSRFADGRCLGVDGSVWLYRSVPLAPVVDAVRPDVGLDAAAPLMGAFDVMSDLAQVRMARRSASKSSYRQVHILLVNIPKRFTPPPGELGAYLAASFSDAEVDRRLLLFGVRLRDRVGGGPGPAELQGPGLHRAARRTGYRLNRAVGSVTQTLSTGITPLEDFDVDFMAVDEALARAGLRVPSTEEFRLANAWWNHGGSPDTVFLEHIDHLHTFTSASSAMAAARLGADGDDCSSWPPMADTHSLAFGCVADFELPFVAGSDPAAHWAADLLDGGAVCVSIRGLVEPPKVTRHELRRRKKQYIDDIRERADQGKMERAEQEETLAELSEVEAVYSMATAPPAIVDCSVLAVFSGRHEVSGYDLSEACRDTGVVLNSMVSRQRHALAETMLCSNVRAVPHLHDLPAQTIACSGLPSLSVVGDPDGALVGFTERDRQPAWLSPTAAASDDQLPMTIVVGETGSGKALSLRERIPTPTGWKTMGELKVGDQVLGRDGRPCTVTFVSEIDLNPDLYRITLSDGQEVLADADHLWVVSEIVARAQPRNPHRRASLATWDATERMAQRLEDMAKMVTGRMTADELLTLVEPVVGRRWASPRSVYVALGRSGCPFDLEERQVDYTVKRTNHRPVPTLWFPLKETLRANLDRWRSIRSKQGNKVRQERIAAAICLLERVDAGELDGGAEVSGPELSDLLRAAGSTPPETTRLAAAARARGVPVRTGEVQIQVKNRIRCRCMARSVAVYPADVALKTLAAYLRSTNGERPATTASEMVVTTAEMLSAGIRNKQGAARYAITVSEPVDLPDQDLPVRPYLLGYWLGDGTTSANSIAVGRTDLYEALNLIHAEWPRTTVSKDRHGNFEVRLLQIRPDLCPWGHGRESRSPRGDCKPCRQVRDALRRGGRDPGVRADGRWNESLAPKLRAAGVIDNKHIPIKYLRASRGAATCPASRVDGHRRHH